jgi:predicted PurR-regulated permease PerM
MAVSWDTDWGQFVWAVVGLAIVALAVYTAYTFFGAIVVGLFLYYAVRPVYRRLEEHIDHPSVTASITLLTVGVPLLLVLVYAGFVALQELRQLLGPGVTLGYRSLLRPYFNVSSLLNSNLSFGTVRNYLPLIAQYASTLFMWALRLFVIAVVAFYLLRDDHKASRWARSTFGARGGVVAFLEGVDDDLTTIYTGNLITIVITSAVAVAVYYALNAVSPQGIGIAFPFLLGLLTGIATLVPAVGMKIVYVPYAAYLFYVSYTSQAAPLWFPVAFLVTTFVVVDSVPDFFIRSYVSKGDINMGLMLLSYVFGAVAFGWYGVFFGPVVLVLFLHFARRVFPNLLRRWPDRFVLD